MVNKKIMLGMLAMVFGLVLAGCPTEPENNSNTGNGGNNTGGQTGGGDGKVTITLQPGSETGNIKLKLSNGTWNTSGAWDATQSSNLGSIMGSLLTTYANGFVDNSKCTATVIESNTALDIELKDSDSLLVVSGKVYTVTTLNPVSFPYTSHGVVSLSEKFQVAGDPVSFVNKTRLYADGGDPWANGTRKIIINGSQVAFWDSNSSGTSFVYTYNIDMWQSDYVDGQYCVTINVSNGKRTDGLNSPPSCITDKTSFTFYFEDIGTSRIYIRQVNGGSFSATDGWDSSFIK